MSDAMMFDIARMPYEMAMSDEMSRRQFYANTQRLAAALEAARAEVERLRADRDSWEQQASDRVADWHAEYLRAERLEEALRESHAEVLRLRDAMFRVYATAANGGDPTDAIEKMRDEMDKPWSGDKARAALAKENRNGSCTREQNPQADD